MCGFIASFGFKIPAKKLKIALECLKRRGPDARGVWQDKNVSLGSRRLSIIDLKKRSNQPMHSICSRYVLVFNGAIYNFEELRNFLLSKGVKLRTYSDTEVIIELYALESEKMIYRLKGMFAFVIWDRKKKQAFAARDPYGIKPLYLGMVDNGLILGSQVKTLLSTGLIKKTRDLKSQFCFWMLGYVIEPRTWFANIKSLKAGHYILIRNGKVILEKKWYDLKKNWLISDSNQKKFLNTDINQIINKSLKETVKRHLVADVPIGIFLSSGVDSIILADLMSKLKNNSITAITVVFEDPDNSQFDESETAKMIAKKYGMKHHVIKVTKKDFLKDLPDIIKSMDQPSIDGVNIWYASKAAANLKIKVVFSGVGGDEIFFGYRHFEQISKIFKYYNFFLKLPIINSFANLVFNLLTFFKKNPRWNLVLKYGETIFGWWLLKRTIYSPMSIIKKDINLKKIINNFTYKNFFDYKVNKFQNIKIELANIESQFYLRNQLLRDSDWASMYHSVELRTPYVDSTLLENLSHIMNDKYFNSKNKQAMVASFNLDISKKILFKKKIGFNTPVSKWISGNKLEKDIHHNYQWGHYMNKVVNLIYSKI